MSSPLKNLTHPLDIARLCCCYPEISSVYFHKRASIAQENFEQIFFGEITNVLKILGGEYFL